MQLFLCSTCFHCRNTFLIDYQDLNNFESNPEEFARTFCADLGIEDPEVGVSKASKLHPLGPRVIFVTVVLCLTLIFYYLFLQSRLVVMRPTCDVTF